MSNETKPHLVIATDNFLPRWDGIARFLAELIPRLLKEYRITVISPDYGSTSLDRRIGRVRIPLSGKRYGDYSPPKWRPSMIRPIIKNADVVFTQTIGPIGILANRYARRYGKPLTAFIHSIEWELIPRALSSKFLKRIGYSLTKFLTRRLYNRCTLLIVPSANIAEMLTWQRIRTKKRVVHLGVETEKFVKGNKQAARQATGIPQDMLVVGFHGRIGYEKNLLTLNRAFLRLKTAKKRLLLVGDGVPELKRRLKQVKGSTLTGVQNDVIPWLQSMDIYVMPSFTETTSLAVLEAMSCELPVISSPVGFIQQYIQEGENGFFFETKNAFDLSVKLQKLASNAALRARIGKAARATVEKEFNWDITAERIGESLRQLYNAKLPQTKST